MAGAVFGDLGVSLFVAGAVFGETGARNVVIFNTKCVAEGGKVGPANGRVQFCNFMVGSWSDHVRIMVGSWSNRPRIGIDASTVFGKFFLDFGIQLCVAGAVFGEVGG